MEVCRMRPCSAQECVKAHSFVKAVSGTCGKGQQASADQPMKYFRQILYRSICILIISAFLCPVFSVRSYALENWSDNVYVASEGACLMDADTGVVLYGKNEEAAYYPASITKVMTALLTIENCDNLSEQVTFSYDAVHIEEDNSTIIGASEGDKLSVLDCLYSLLFQSANEVANALAEHVGAKHPELKENGMSDRDVFIRMMNDRAAELGCTGTHFNNPSGLTDSNHYVTAHDMCRILAAAIKNETFLDIESHTYWTHAPIRRYPDADDPWNTVYAKHAMLKRNSSQYYSGAIAGKTGYTMSAGNTLVTAAVRDGMTLVTCVLNAHANHYNDTRRLLDFGFDNFTSLKVTDYDDINSLIAADYRIGGVNMLDSLTLGIDADTKITIPKGGSYVEVRKSLETIPKDDGTESAELIYTYGDKTVGKAELKLISIGDSSELYEGAKEDPLLANALGLEYETTQAASAQDNASSEEKASAQSETSAGANDIKDEEAAAADEAGGSMNDTASQDGSGTGFADRIMAVFGKLKASVLSDGDFLKKLAVAAVVIIVLIAAAAAFNTARDKRMAEIRAKRRAERLARTSDMSGTQQIRMDIELNRRLRKRKRKR